MIRGSVSKSGNPCAKLIARSGPFSSRLSRVISRMTDSVKLSAFSERCAPTSVPRIRALQVNVGARAREAKFRPLEPALPAPAYRARPARLGEEVEDVGAAQQADHLAVLDDRHTADPFACQQAGRLVDARVLGHRDDVRAHDVAGELALLREDVDLRDDADDHPIPAEQRSAGDALRGQGLRDLLDRRVLFIRDDGARHPLFSGDHAVFSSLATVSKFALPPLSTRPVRPPGSLPARYAASGRAPVGSSARRSRVHATRAASAIWSSETVTMSSTRRLV